MTAYSVEPPTWVLAAMALNLLATCLVGCAVAARRLTDRRRGTVVLASTLNLALEWIHRPPVHPNPLYPTPCGRGRLAAAEVHRR